MKLTDVLIKNKYKIKKINYEQDYELAVRLNHLGFLEGTIVYLKCKSPINSSALVVEVKGALLALSNHEASHIHVFHANECEM
ncbi:MAG: ferrous iron transport protein A [Bacteriovoracaceae bacterium]|nr:ferrous iron transport protein A [Bacteriovoracaceae bacterium]